MNVLKSIFGVTIGIAGGLLIISAIYPTAANQVLNGNAVAINNTATDNVYKLLPLIGVVVLFGTLGMIAANAVSE